MQIGKRQVELPEGQRFEQGVKFKARISILNTVGQSFQRTRVLIDQNYKREITSTIMALAVDAGRMQELARRDHGEKYFIHIEVPASNAIEDEVNSWIHAIANSQIKAW